jgi:CDP-diacylglycerol--glycerol-3-phosphate 3-phosphatidyltransferase
MSKLPNFLTLLRIFLLPLLIFLIIADDNSYNLAIIILFMVIAMSDYFDGIIARKTNSTSEFGKMLDPIADKLFVILLIITFIYNDFINEINLIPAYIIIFREIFISGLREYASNLPEIKKIDVSILGKYKTAFQILSLFLILIGNIYIDLRPLLNVGIYLFWLSTIITLISAYQYYKGIF